MEKILFNNFEINPSWERRKEIDEGDEKHYIMILPKPPTSNDEFKMPFLNIVNIRGTNYRLLVKKMLSKKNGEVLESRELESAIDWIETFLDLTEKDMISLGWIMEDHGAWVDGYKSELNSKSPDFFKRNEWDSFREVLDSFKYELKNRLGTNIQNGNDSTEFGKKYLRAKEGKKLHNILEYITLEKDRQTLTKCFLGEASNEKVKINVSNKRILIHLFAIAYYSKIRLGKISQKSVADFISRSFLTMNKDGDHVEISTKYCEKEISETHTEINNKTYKHYLNQTMRSPRLYRDLRDKVVELYEFVYENSKL